jgi:hypothetical protein
MLFVDVHVDVLELLFEDVHEAACAGAFYVFLDLAEEGLFLGEGEKGDLMGEGGWVGALAAGLRFRGLEVGGDWDWVGGLVMAVRWRLFAGQSRI